MTTAMQYHRQAHDLAADLSNKLASGTLTVDALLQGLQRVAELSRLRGMAEVVERASAAFVFAEAMLRPEDGK